MNMFIIILVIFSGRLMKQMIPGLICKAYQLSLWKTLVSFFPFLRKILVIIVTLITLIFSPQGGWMCWYLGVGVF